MSESQITQQLAPTRPVLTAHPLPCGREIAIAVARGAAALALNMARLKVNLAAG